MKTKIKLTYFREDPKRLSSELNSTSFWYGTFSGAFLGGVFTLLPVRILEHYLETGKTKGLVPLGVGGGCVLVFLMLFLWGSAISIARRERLCVYRDLLNDQGVDYDSAAEQEFKIRLLAILVGLVVGGLITTLTLFSI